MESAVAAVREVVRDGISMLLPFYETLPELHLCLGKNHLPSLEYGTNYFLQLSKVNDLNRMSTDMLRLFTHDIAIPETDLEKIYGVLGVKNVKSYGRGIKADAVVVDLGARNKIYKKDRDFVRSNNYLTENNLYMSDYKLLTFEVFRPVFEFSSEKYCIVKLPTAFGRGVVNVARVYCSLFRTVRLIKCASDSWLKDSFVIVASEPHAANMARFASYVASVTRSSTWKESNNVQFTILDEPVEREFIDKFLAFSARVYQALYYIHSLLYASMTSESKSIENEHQKRIMKLLAG
ncbi:mRNA capping small sub-unit [Squirrelpox virus]|uniref:mRNA capping small sub-unit n=1 Tax=Squirrelpox virus TaxID=240426 RepID=U3UBJ2_9POXV|nr:mRNA capping small sub-unit [Squirrelpox virus]CCD83269.1 mRNA capping small sub-unit [Squirrelpox virus]